VFTTCPPMIGLLAAPSTARVGRGYVGFTSVQPVDTSVSRPVLASVMSTVDLDPDYATRMWSWLMTVIPQTTLQDFSVVQSVSALLRRRPASWTLRSSSAW
jgi:hypothetical protein